MNAVRNYRDLSVWQKSMQLVTDIYQHTQIFPKEEIYGLTSQMRRAAVSIPSNIAEGQSKRSTKDYIRFLQIAYGSTAELETQIMISDNLSFLPLGHSEILLEQCNEICRMLNGLISSLEMKLPKAQSLSFPESQRLKPEA